MADSNGDSAARLTRQSNPRLPAQGFIVGDRVQVSTDADPQTYVISEAQINKEERVWTYALKEEGKEDTKWVEEGELKR